VGKNHGKFPHQGGEKCLYSDAVPKGTVAKFYKEERVA
jgi:hypothetical protein